MTDLHLEIRPRSGPAIVEEASSLWGPITIVIHPGKPDPFVDDWHGFDPQFQYDHIKVDISVQSFNYFARLVEYFAPFSNHFKSKFNWKEGQEISRHWILNQYLMSSLACTRFFTNPPFDVVLKTFIHGKLFILKSDLYVVTACEIYRTNIPPTEKRDAVLEVQMYPGMYAKVRHFMAHMFPDIHEGDAIQAIIVLFNHSTYYLRTGIETNMRWFADPISSNEEYVYAPNFPYS